MGSTLFALLLTSTLVLTNHEFAGATVISSSKLERCVQDGTVAAASLECDEKIVVAIAIEGGRTLDTETLEFDLGCVGSSRCPCPCNYVSDPECTCRDLNQRLTINLRKSPVHATYPLKYIQSFNARPKEVVHAGLTKCEDGEYKDAPTCGWYYEGGQKVPDSQGFCCECSSGQILTDTFGNLEERTRGNLNCDFFSNTWNPFGPKPSSAHCLYLDPKWYEGFEMGSAQVQFNIDVSLVTESWGNTVPPANSSSPIDEEELSLSPSEPHKISQNKTVEVKLLGDLAGYTELPTMSDKMLMVPFPPGADPGTALTSNQDQWMAVSKSEISLDGGECDKVGTSFTAFRYQPGGCSRGVGSCLSNQLEDKFEEDMNRTRDGFTPMYLLSQYSSNPEVNKMSGGASSSPLVLQFPITQIRNSIVTLSVAADDMRFIVHASPGDILDARVCQFANVTCGGFEALTDRGYLTVEVKNTGYIDADYTVTVSNCSSGVLEMNAQHVALRPAESEVLPSYHVHMATDAGNEDMYCWVNLLNSLGEVSDTREVKFYVNQTQFDDKAYNPDFKNGTGPGVEYVKLSCKNFCPRIYDIPCILVKRCWSRLMLFFGAVLLVFMIVSLAIAAVRRGWCSKICGIWGRTVWSKKKKKEGKPKASRGDRTGAVRKSVAMEMMMEMMAGYGLAKQNALPLVGDSQSPLMYANAAINPMAAAAFPKLSPLTQQKVNGESRPPPAGMLYLNLSVLGAPNWLLSPGPSCCLAGTGQHIQSFPGTPPSLLFIVPTNRAHQRFAYDADLGEYKALPQPVPFDCTKATVVLEEASANALICSEPIGQCLN